MNEQGMKLWELLEQKPELKEEISYVLMTKKGCSVSCVSAEEIAGMIAGTTNALLYQSEPSLVNVASISSVFKAAIDVAVKDYLDELVDNPEINAKELASDALNELSKMLKN